MADSSLLVILPWQDPSPPGLCTLSLAALLSIDLRRPINDSIVASNYRQYLWYLSKLLPGTKYVRGLIHSSFLAYPLWTLVRSSTCVPQSVDRGEAQCGMVGYTKRSRRPRTDHPNYTTPYQQHHYHYCLLLYFIFIFLYLLSISYLLL